MKRCPKCGEIKSKDQFYRSSSKKDGLHSLCKICDAAIRHRWRLKNKDRERENVKKWRQSNREKFNAWTREWRAKQPEKKKEQIRIQTKKYYIANREDIIKRTVANVLAKRRSDPKYRLMHNISSGINQSLKGDKHGRHWEDLVGYTLVDLQRHLEKYFISGMSWSNYGASWHIDHIIPVSAFMFNVPNDLGFKQCWALANLRPLWTEDNLSKGDIIVDPLAKAVLKQVSA